MDCICLYTARLRKGKRGAGREGVLLALVLLRATHGGTAAPVLALVNALGALGSKLQSGSRCQALAHHSTFLWKQ